MATCQVAGTAALECDTDPHVNNAYQNNAGIILGDITNDAAIVEFRPITDDPFIMSVIFTYVIV
jgi:hypothetical protein